MPSRVAPPFRSARTAFAIAAIVLGGCVPATRGVETHTSVVASAGSTVASVTKAFGDTQKV
jgi:hypothetical protein